MSYGSILIANYPELIIAHLADADDQGGAYVLTVPDFPDLEYKGWSLNVPKTRVLEVNQTTELMALAYLRQALPPKPDLSRRDWRGKAELKIQISDMKTLYQDYARGKAKPMPRAEFEATFAEFLRGTV